MKVFKGRVIKAGHAKGLALVSQVPIGFLGGVDPQSGIVVEPGHPLRGESVAGKVLVFPQGKGSTVGSYTILRLAANSVAPAAIVNLRSEPIVAVGALLAEIPMVDLIPIEEFRTGDFVTVEGDTVTIRRNGDP